MDIRILEELLLKERLLYVKLSEFEDLTRQLGEALRSEERRVGKEC